MTDSYNLQRFVDAQDPKFKQVRAELRSGKKTSHWMWFIFPQIKGLGFSPDSQWFAISGVAEAKAYLDHGILGPRLRECTRLVNLIEGRSAEAIFGGTDAMKFRSSMTLFANATSDNQAFCLALRKYFDGEPDPATLARL